MQPITLEYIAGFVDGEGTFSITKGTVNSYCPRFGVYNTNLKVIKDIQKCLNIGLKISKVKHRNDKWKTLYRLDSVTIDQCKQAAMLLEPHLRQKKEHAQLIIKFQRSDPTKRGIGQHGDFAANYHNLKLRDRIMFLNKKGPDNEELSEGIPEEPDQQMTFIKGGEK